MTSVKNDASPLYTQRELKSIDICSKLRSDENWRKIMEHLNKPENCCYYYVPLAKKLGCNAAALMHALHYVCTSKDILELTCLKSDEVDKALKTLLAHRYIRIEISGDPPERYVYAIKQNPKCPKSR